ncbi:putative P450 monooxygenase [Thozetella sp. PMI_491]|nr:putative P450 monooxygenase [Thozetella sp. PMI_491]
MESLEHLRTMLQHPSTLLRLAVGVVILPIAYYCYLAIYNVYFHPLSRYPGPKVAAASDYWFVRSHLRGSTPLDILKLHNRYGPIVRVAPNELSYVNPIAWQEIYGHKKAGQPELSKDKKYHSGFGAEPTLLNADREYHSLLRKLLAGGFSDSALRQQEPLIQQHVDLMMKKLQENGADGNIAQDLAFTFDIIGHLTYGESFGCLENSRLHTWVKLFFHAARYYAYFQVAGRLPGFLKVPFFIWYIPSSMKNTMKTTDELSTAKVKYRLEMDETIPDFMGNLAATYREGKMTFNQLVTNAKILTGAGSETTATLLAGVTWLLLTYPETLNRLTAEIRGKFNSAGEITIASVNTCKYLLACLEEALRIYPPSPATHARYVPPGGMKIDGIFVPEDTAVGIAIVAACRSPLNFTDPEVFIPERWMKEDSTFAGDRKAAAQVFSCGPRNCIGRNLAYVEMKLVIARLVWQFDLENCTEGDWMDQKIFLVWEKHPLVVKLHPVRPRQEI